LFGAHQTVDRSLDFFRRRLAATVDKFSNVKITVWMQQELVGNSGGAFAEYIGENIVELDVGNGETVLSAILFSDRIAGQLDAVTHKVAKLPDFKRRNKTAGDEIVFKNIRDPLRILGIGFLPANRFDVLGVRQDDITRAFKYVVYGDPIFPCGLHTNIPAIVFGKPYGQASQIAGERRETASLVGCYPLFVGCRDTSNDKGFVDVNPTADGVYDPECHIQPPRKNTGTQTGTDRSAKNE
jgi:hypothetical protein